MTATPMSPTELLAASDHLADHAAFLSPTLLARTRALLIRQAIEATMARVWSAKADRLLGVPFTTQLLCLREYVSDTRLADDVAQAWARLSRACHHGGYASVPATGELERARELVGRLVTVAGSVT